MSTDSFYSGVQAASKQISNRHRWVRGIIFALSLPQLTDLANVSVGFPLRCILPVPHRQAVLALSAKNGWPKDGILQGLSVNIGWLEHHSTRLVNTPGAVHCRAATIAAFFAGPPSTRKPWTVGIAQ